MFKYFNGSANDCEIPKITYNEFLKELKTVCTSDTIGLNPALFATHSLRRGSVSNQFANGVPDKVIKYSGRCRSNPLRHILIMQFFLNYNCKLFSHQNKKVGYWQVDVNHHTTTLQYSIQRKPSTTNSSIDSSARIMQFEKKFHRTGRNKKKE
jgi:hypothetical protein